MKVAHYIKNRFSLIFAFWCVLLAYCAFVSTNVYINAIVLSCGFILCILFGSWTFESNNQTDGEKHTITYLNDLFK